MTKTTLTRPGAALTPWRSRMPAFFTGGPLASLREEMEDLLSRFSLDWNGGMESALNVPSLDISETDDEIEIRMDAPGMKPEEIEIEVTGDMVRISGEHKEEKEETGRKFHRIERRTGAFERSVRMPCLVNEQNVSAEYHDGVLKVTMAKSEEAKTHKIPVKG